MPLISKTDNVMIQKFLKGLTAIVETTTLTHDMLNAYHIVMEFLEVPKNLDYIQWKTNKLSLVERLQYDIEAFVHGVLQTPQLRQITSMAISSCGR